MKQIIIFLLVFCLGISVPAYSEERNLLWPTPIVLEEGQPAKEDIYVYTEDQFSQLLWLEAYYKISEKRWGAERTVYNEALKEASKKLKPRFWSSFKAGFICGVGLIILSAWAVGQIN